MRSMAFKESGPCMLPHLILKLCEYRYSTMPSILEYRLAFHDLLMLTVSFQEKLENDIKITKQGKICNF